MAQYFDYTYRNKDSSTFQAPIFNNYIETQYYWTATTDAADPTAAWTIYSCDFGLYDIPKSSVGYTLAVRQVFLASDNLKSFYPFPGPCDPNHTVL